MASLLLNISSNTNQFVDLKCLSFKKLLISNSDSEAININLAIGKDDNAGQTSITNGGYVYQGIKIPQGVTLCIDGLDFSDLVSSSVVSNALREDDYTLLISANATDKVYTLFIEY
tara:strand:- start:531 stop:878 length:348 start_codon:yes stop_codon:yes gene_type:complete